MLKSATPQENIAEARRLFNKLLTVEYKTVHDVESFVPQELKDRILSLLDEAGATLKALDPEGEKGDKEMRFALDCACGNALAKITDLGVRIR